MVILVALIGCALVVVATGEVVRTLCRRMLVPQAREVEDAARTPEAYAA
jgi:hypothetical protein